MSKLYDFDNRVRKENKITYIAGFDEAGRGPLAGPVSAAIVILKPEFNNEIINDSKKLTDKKRREVFNLIKDNSLFYHVELVDVKTIDEINILEADLKGMQIGLNLAIENNVKPEFLISDYLNIKSDIKLLSIAKGDATSFSVACASILAKVTRDDYMNELSLKYPAYEFDKNKGYGTKKHIEAIKKYGYIKGVHRLSFEPIKSLVNKEEEIKLFDF